jgi:hypothetical protein
MRNQEALASKEGLKKVQSTRLRHLHAKLLVLTTPWLSIAALMALGHAE